MSCNVPDFKLEGFAKIYGDKIMIYDYYNRLRHIILPNESQFYSNRSMLVIDQQGLDKKINIVCNFINEYEATQARELLIVYKNEINTHQMNIKINNAKEGNVLVFNGEVWTNSKSTIKDK